MHVLPPCSRGGADAAVVGDLASPPAVALQLQHSPGLTPVFPLVDRPSTSWAGTHCRLVNSVVRAPIVRTALSFTWSRVAVKIHRPIPRAPPILARRDAAPPDTIGASWLPLHRQAVRRSSAKGYPA